MNLKQKMCLASIVGLLAASGQAATDGVPPGAPSDRAISTGASGGVGTSAEPATRVSDNEITMKVRAELLATKGLKSTGIRVRTENGVVHLDGKVQSDSEKLTALNATRAVEGVRSVSDGLQVVK